MVKTEDAGLVRVNTRIGEHHNKFLDDYSKETGVSKSGLIQIAVDRFMRETQGMSSMEQLLAEIKEMKREMQK